MVTHSKIISSYRTMENIQEILTTVRNCQKIRTEYAHKSFHYTGTKIYNDLPLKISTIANAAEYERSLNAYYKKT